MGGDVNGANLGVAPIAKKGGEKRSGVKTKTVGSFVTWQENIEFATDDCVVLFFIRQCAYITFTFEYRGTITDIDAENENYIVQVVNVKRIDPSMVSVKYIQLKEVALNQIRQQSIGNIKTVKYPMVR
ncbi:MAG: hypothetical protein HQK67_11455 [Desulfamplus sp.]|nr:hypothetical protein [Desulfamplus sp.]